MTTTLIVIYLRYYKLTSRIALNNTKRSLDSIFYIYKTLRNCVIVNNGTKHTSGSF